VHARVVGVAHERDDAHAGDAEAGSAERGEGEVPGAAARGVAPRARRAQRRTLVLAHVNREARAVGEEEDDDVLEGLAGAEPGGAGRAAGERTSGRGG
jgi:hypothetical protein